MDEWMDGRMDGWMDGQMKKERNKEIKRKEGKRKKKIQTFYVKRSFICYNTFLGAS
jgi:hypothetical protein